MGSIGIFPLQKQVKTEQVGGAEDCTPNDNIWDPGKGGEEEFEHNMLLVGYDRKNKVFIAKNSWGYDNKEEEGFTLFSYDWATNGNIKWGIYITKIIENPKVNEREKQKFIGRWTFSLNGRGQILDINRILLFYYLDWYEPLKIYSATPDYRLGGFHFVQNREGKSTGIFQLRVNGTIHSNQLNFYTDIYFWLITCHKTKGLFPDSPIKKGDK